MSANISSSSFSSAFVALIVATSVSSVYASGPFDTLNLSLSSLITARNMLFAVGILLLGVAGYLYLSFGCSSSSGSGLKKNKNKNKKIHNTRSGSAESSKSKSSSSSASQRKSPRKPKA